MSEKNLPNGIRWLLGKGWIYQNQLNIDRLYQEHCLPAVDVAQHRVYLERGGTSGATNILEATLKRRTPYNLFAWLLFPAYEKACSHFARSQASVDLARVACALERYRLAHGEYPPSLAALAPQFLDAIPPDVFDGKPLRYRRNPNGSFILYSVGQNRIDDGGKIVLTKGKHPRIDFAQGDLVWQYP
jgi:hypothetical protein